MVGNVKISPTQRPALLNGWFSDALDVGSNVFTVFWTT